ncbi:transmembrane protease serine 11F-like [Melitaea cinxia]|uniref:transmembrane protease serine 11F-like n=1 Tax=Melitaea cinxia TaxID=113334 RepID=UPI001E272510|nr:transmembrane protease serine 11F-like [Melitaea cinxia]
MASPLMLLNLFLVTFLVQRTFASSHVQPRILYGEDAKIENYPFYAGLANCGAAIISSTWVLTAAHCVADIRTKSGYVWVGGESFANSIKVPYNKVIVHEYYHTAPLIMNDVAVIELATPLKFSKKIQPIKLPTKPVATSKVAFVGRGRDETGKVSANLKKLDLIKLTTEQCVSLLPPQYQSLVKPNIKVLEMMTLCAKRAEDKPSICRGDSGSPLFSGNRLVGLASYIGSERCSELRLGFYVNVTSYVPWIKSVTGL